jgi:peptidoglycan/xylan/chitin deacetylase (PgdA/CDA1 family)
LNAGRRYRKQGRRRVGAIRRGRSDAEEIRRMTPEYILNFHGIGAPDRPFDPGEQPYWISARLFGEIVALIAPAVRAGRVGVTFDDGNKSDAAIALPVLREAGVPATFFVLAGRVGAPGFLARDDIAALEAAGMAIGSHGFDHVDWRKLDAPGRRRELIEARATLRTLCAGGVTTAAIPFGAYDRAVLGHLKAAGYDAAYTSDGGRAGRGPVFARTSVRGDMTPDDIRLLLSGHENPLRRLRRTAAILRKRLL